MRWVQETNSHVKLVEYEDGTTEPDDSYTPTESTTHSLLNRQRDSVSSLATKTTDPATGNKTGEPIVSTIVNRQSLSRDSIGTPLSPRSRESAKPDSQTFRIFVIPAPNLEKPMQTTKLFEKTFDLRQESSPQSSFVFGVTRSQVGVYSSGLGGGQANAPGYTSISPRDSAYQPPAQVVTYTQQVTTSPLSGQYVTSYQFVEHKEIFSAPETYQPRAYAPADSFGQQYSAATTKPSLSNQIAANTQQFPPGQPVQATYTVAASDQTYPMNSYPYTQSKDSSS